jgi:hypothetical protein
MPRIEGQTYAALEGALSGSVLVTPDPAGLATEALKQIDTVLAFGRGAAGTVSGYARDVGLRAPLVPGHAPDEVLLLLRADPAACGPVQTGAPRQNHERHKGKYALGNLGQARSFHFVDVNGNWLGSARNLAEFIRLALAAPDVVWDRHLHAGDFRAWFLDVIRDEDLACRAARAAEDPQIDASRGRGRIIEGILERYVIPDHALSEPGPAADDASEGYRPRPPV